MAVSSITFIRDFIVDALVNHSLSGFHIKPDYVNFLQFVQYTEMDGLPALGTSIPGALPGTFKIYGDLQTKNKAAILAIAPKEHSYGPHPRQKLDLYSPPNSSADEDDSPILIFLYGGGLERGDKIMSHPPGPEEGLTYKNIGAYFAVCVPFLAFLPLYHDCCRILDLAPQVDERDRLCSDIHIVT